ncbi:primosomal protein N' [Candidatus Microgenomates bacterium]|nr:primosomal protein N' [Candidatus Microgenomates bacterium]
MSPAYADLALNTKSGKKDDLFTYAVPVTMREEVRVGQMAQAPLGPRKINGIIVALHNTKPTFATREIAKIIDEEPLVSERMIELARFISDYYWCGLGQTIFSFLPLNLRKRKRGLFSANSKFKILNSKQVQNSKSKISNLDLTKSQKDALEKIKKAIVADKPKTFLLHGVTASGKTEIYLRAFAQMLNEGETFGAPKVSPSLKSLPEKRAGGIFIVPEIALTPQSISSFEKVFGVERIAVVHSKLSAGERLKTWQAIRAGEKDIVIGSRSAIFAPLPNLKLIIIDEEHDLISFKSDQTPRYELHTVAEKLAELSGATMILGSATPLVESYYRVLQGDWKYLSLPERVTTFDVVSRHDVERRDGKAQMPKIKLINMADERKGGNDSPLSEYLQKALSLVLKNKRQALLFLNRRGMAHTLICQDCREIVQCEDCSSPLVYHLISNRLQCHHCSRVYSMSIQCKKCGGFNVKFLGQGTERIEQEIKKLFPTARVARMDRDTMEKEEDYESIFSALRDGKIDILVGTQMIVHGWDIPSVDLACVISLDNSLMIPDFRSEEKVFSLITQLAGRTGRGLARGMLVVQTEFPDHPVFQLAEYNDFAGFMKKELEERERFGYPPFGQIVKLSLGGTNKDLVFKKAEELADILKSQFSNLKSQTDSNNQDPKIKNYKIKNYGVAVIGPIEPAVAKKFGKYYQNILIKFSVFSFQFSPAESLRGILTTIPKDWTIDVDPLSLL